MGVVGSGLGLRSWAHFSVFDDCSTMVPPLQGQGWNLWLWPPPSEIPDTGHSAP